MKGLLIKGIAVLLIAAALTGIAAFAAVNICAKRTREVKASDCLIVLGAKVKADGQLSNSLRYRCVSALEAWKHGVARNIIVCGGQGADEPCTEAEAMRSFLVTQGVPEDAVHMESASTDTRENLRYAASIMAENGWKTAAVVTSDYHVQRALWLAQDIGLDACGIAARSPQSPWGWLYARGRESCSWVVYGLRRLLKV